MIPSAFVFLEALPVTATGKMDRRALAERDPGAAVAHENVLPRDLLELRLARLWEEVLDVRPVGVRDDFFELGGHSLLTVRLAALVRSRLGLELPLASLFQAPTVERMAALLRAQGSTASRPPRVEIQPGAPGRRPLFLVHPIGGNVLAYTELARRLGPELPVHGLQTPDEPPAALEEMADLYLEAIREVQPEGPYRLAGWSMGGLVAWEMARRLVACGETVELLALIDTLAHGVPEPDAGDATLAAWFAADLARTLGFEPADLDLGGRDSEEVLLGALAMARESDVLPPGLEIEDLRRLFALYRVNYRAMAAYEPGPYSGPVRLLHAASRNGHVDPALGWSALAAGGVTVEAIPGDHYSILRGEGATALAARLAEGLASPPQVETFRAVGSTEDVAR
jgi:thioesterase domain-containing protein/acyl carrier protein